MMNAVGKWLENDKTPGRKVSIGLDYNLINC